MTPDATARDLGEAGLVAAVTAALPQRGGVLLGPGDDAAVVAAPDGRVVVTTDVLVEGVHFRRDWSGGYDVGRKAAAANLADVAAMGARGTALVVALTTPGDVGAGFLADLARGLDDEAALVGASVVGGDTVRGDRLQVAVTALGDLGGRSPVTRTGARPGDVLVVVGALGRSGAGLAALERGVAPSHPGVVGSHLRPAPPYAAVGALAAVASAMCDLSDGLALDAGRLAVASSVAVDLRTPEAVDRDVLALAADLALPPERCWLYGGEDHALLAAVAPGDLPLLTGWGAQVVGTVSAGPPGVTWAGAALDGAASWQHFR